MPNPPVSRDDALQVRDLCLCLNVQRAARSLARRFDEVFRPLDITNGQFSLLMALSGPEPPPMGALARLLAMDRTTLTAALKPLERRKLVKVAPDPNDRRRKVLSLTPAGRKLLGKALPLWKQAHAQLDALLPPDGPDRLRTALHAVT
jgi:DNA-binding MarR family transcriptional regulator